MQWVIMANTSYLLYSDPMTNVSSQIDTDDTPSVRKMYTDFMNGNPTEWNKHCATLGTVLSKAMALNAPPSADNNIVVQIGSVVREIPLNSVAVFLPTNCFGNPENTTRLEEFQASIQRAISPSGAIPVITTAINKPNDGHRSRAAALIIVIYEQKEKSTVLSLVVVRGWQIMLNMDLIRDTPFTSTMIDPKGSLMVYDTVVPNGDSIAFRTTLTVPRQYSYGEKAELCSIHVGQLNDIPAKVGFVEAVEQLNDVMEDVELEEGVEDVEDVEDGMENPADDDPPFNP